MGMAPDNTLVLRDLDSAPPNSISDHRWIMRDHVEAYEVRDGGVIYSVWKPYRKCWMVHLLLTEMHH